MSARSPHAEVYKDVAGEWRWRIRAANGRIVADSGEGYKRRRACERGLRIVGSAAVRYTLNGDECTP